MKYYYESEDFLQKFNPDSIDRILCGLEELSYEDYRGFTRRWITEQIILMNQMTDEEFTYLVKGKKE